MVKEADLNILVSNVLSENHHKHCRLCLIELTDPNFVRLEDCVSLDDSKGFQQLTQILSNLLGPEVSQEIAGMDAVCSNCVETALECSKFLENCRRSNTLLHKVFEHLSEALQIEVEDSMDLRLYVIVNEHESKAILMDKEEDKPFSKPIVEEKKNPIVEKKEVVHVSFVCMLCKQAFVDESQLIEHEKKGHHLKCPECTQHRCSEESLKEHVDKAHTLYVCKDCGKPCYGLDKLEVHEKRHSMSKHKCPKCEKVYLTQSSYVKHIELCLADKLEPHPYRGRIKKSYFCDKCGKGYSTPGGLRVHERFTHGNAKPHICEYCGKTFTAPSYLKIHMVRHTGEKKFNCNICHKNFVSKEALLYHTRRHTGEKPFSCKLCPERFVNASARAEHIKYKHNAPTLTCDICLKKFFTSSFLKQHKKRHLDPVSKLYKGHSRSTQNTPEERNITIDHGTGEDDVPIVVQQNINADDIPVIVQEESC